VAAASAAAAASVVASRRSIRREGWVSRWVIVFTLRSLVIATTGHRNLRHPLAPVHTLPIGQIIALD